MSHSRALPELVRDSQLEVVVQGDTTVHAAPLECRDSILPQYWETVKPLGRGGDGTVFLQQKIEGPGNVQLLAVKQIVLQADLTSEDHDSKRYVRELEALAKFAQGRVSYITEHCPYTLLTSSAVRALFCENIRLVSASTHALYLHGALHTLGPRKIPQDSCYLIGRMREGHFSSNHPRVAQDAR